MLIFYYNSYQVLDLEFVNPLVDVLPEVRDYIPEAVDTAITSSMNLRNSYTPDEQIIPQEFIFQPADGHLWYTKEMISDRTVLWDAVVKLTWGENGSNKLIRSK